MWRNAPSVSSSVRRSPPSSSGPSSPCTRASGGASTFRCRSEPSTVIRRRRAASTSNILLRIGRSCVRLERGTLLLGDVAELLSLCEALQLLERLILDLANALARHVERAPDLVERARVLAAEPVAQLEHAPL